MLLISARAGAGSIVTDVGSLGGEFTVAVGLNELNEVVGYSEDAGGNSHAFYWHDGSLSDLGTFGGSWSVAYDINNFHQIAGTAHNASALPRAFRCNGGPPLVPLGLLFGGNRSYARAINDAGEVVGDSEIEVSPGFLRTHAVLWQAEIPTDLGALLPAWSSSWAEDVNAAGDVVGTAYLWNTGETRAILWTRVGLTWTWQDLGSLGGPGAPSYAFGMNAARQVVGMSYSAPTMPPGQQLPFFWNGSLLSLGTLGGNYGYAGGINTIGEVVGAATDASQDYRAFYWNGGPLEDLNGRLSATTSWVLGAAGAINEAGSIVGWGYHHGIVSGYLLRPCTGGCLTAAPGTPPVSVFSIAPLDDTRDPLMPDCGEDPVYPRVARVLFYANTTGKPLAADSNPYWTTQPQSAQVELTANLDGDCAEVYFEVRDPDDLEPYDDPAADDNMDTFSTAPLSPQLGPAEGFCRSDSAPLDATRVTVLSIGNVAKAILQITNGWAGDDYVVRVRAGQPPSWATQPPDGEFEYPRFVAWTRVYAKVATMYDKSWELTSPSGPSTDPMTIHLKPFASGSGEKPEPGDVIRVFDAASVHNLRGEFSVVVLSVANPLEIVLTVNPPLTRDFKPTDGASVIVLPSPIGPPDHASKPLPLDTSLLDVAFDDVRHEFKVLREADHFLEEVPNHALDGSIELDDFQARWFEHRSTEHMLRLIGADRVVGLPPREICPTCVPPAENCDRDSIQGKQEPGKQWAYVFDANMKSSSVVQANSGTILAHEVGHFFGLRLVDEIIDPPPPPSPPVPLAVSPCPVIMPALLPDFCMMHFCMNPKSLSPKLEKPHIFGNPAIARYRLGEL